MVIIEAKLGSEIAVVDDESKLNLVRLEAEETNKNVQKANSLTAEQQTDAMRLLEVFQCIFLNIPGITHLAEHNIYLMTKSLIRVRPYPIPYAKRQGTKKEVQTILETDAIEPAMSEYKSPIALVKQILSRL